METQSPSSVPVTQDRMWSSPANSADAALESPCFDTSAPRF